MSTDRGGVRALLAAEIERRLDVFTRTEPTSNEVGAALHALRGSAAVAGQQDLALVLAQLGARLRGGDASAAAAAHDLLHEAMLRLQAGVPAFRAEWPEPPNGLGPSTVDPRYRLEYLAAMRERLRELEVLALSAEPAPKLHEQAYRTVHAMKGAASAVGDDTTAWYCHGLEARLQSVELSAGVAEGGLAVDLGQHRRMLQLFLEDPAEALRHLRRFSEGARDVEAHAKALHPSRPPSADEEALPADSLLHIHGSVIDRLVERLERVDRVHDELMGAADVARQMAGRMRDLRGSLYGALRLIGPPRPWGAPAAALQRIEATARTLGVAAENAERGAQLCRRNAEVVRVRAAEMRSDLSVLRRTAVGWLFERVANAVERIAADQERQVQVLVVGADLSIDRRVAERLLDPVMQLARNAVAHGIQPPEARVAAGKAPVGTILLAAHRLGDWLRIVIEDDGSGVDVARIRELARAHGPAEGDFWQTAQDEELLALLFVPGVTTREGADLWSGRGMGLDLARDAVRRLGGAIRLANRADGGLSATLEVPSERGVMDVVWVEAAGHEFALPVTFTGRARAAPLAGAVAPLASCLGLVPRAPPRLALELVIHGVQPISIGIERLGAIEETNIRPIPGLVAALGPYSGAILRGDGSLSLALDAALLAARAWGHAAPLAELELR